MARRASARASTSERGAASKWCVNRSAVLGPMPGSRLSSSISRPMTPTASLPTITLHLAADATGSEHPRQTTGHVRGEAQAGEHLRGLLRNLLANLRQGLVRRRLDEVLKQLLVFARQRRLGQLAAEDLHPAVHLHLDRPSTGVPLRHDLAEVRLELLHLLLDAAGIAQKAHQLSQFSEHRLTPPRSRPSPRVPARSWLASPRGS